MRSLPLLLVLTFASPAFARAWRGIEPGVTSRDTVIQKFGEPSKIARTGDSEVLAYMGKKSIEGTRQAQFKVDPKTGIVQRIDVFPGPVISIEEVEKSYGPVCPSGPPPATPCHLEQRTPSNQTYFAYPKLGLVIFFNADEKTVNSLVFQPPSAR
jgi:hypothetical protein